MGLVDWTRRRMLDVLTPVTKEIGALHEIDTHHLITEANFVAAKKLQAAGCIFVTRMKGEASNLVIPGFWTHAAIVYGQGDLGDDEPQIIQATRAGVVMSGLPSFMFSKDYVMLLRPKFASLEQQKAAAEWAKLQIGKPYDWDFDPAEADGKTIKTPAAFYCSKLCWAAYQAVIGPSVPFALRKTLGVNTVVPNDIAMATDKFDILWDSRS